MRDHLSYLKYVIKHKWYVLLAAVELRVPLWRALLHDWSKFLPSEWQAYVKTFYAPDGSKHYVESGAFNQAWNAHQKRQPHHWQYHLLQMDDGRLIPLEMPEVCVREMVADWIGAGRAITGKREAWPWYQKNAGKMILHPQTRKLVESLLTRQVVRDMALRRE